MPNLVHTPDCPTPSWTKPLRRCTQLCWLRQALTLTASMSSQSPRTWRLRRKSCRRTSCECLLLDMFGPVCVCGNNILALEARGLAVHRSRFQFASIWRGSMVRRYRVASHRPASPSHCVNCLLRPMFRSEMDPGSDSIPPSVLLSVLEELGGFSCHTRVAKDDAET